VAAVAQLLPSGVGGAEAAAAASIALVAEEAVFTAAVEVEVDPMAAAAGRIACSDGYYRKGAL